MKKKNKNIFSWNACLFILKKIDLKENLDKKIN